VVGKAVRWEDTKRQARELNPDWDAPERVAGLERGRAEQRGYQLAQLRKTVDVVARVGDWTVRVA